MTAPMPSNMDSDLPPQAERLWTREFLLFILSNFFFFIAFYCLLPTMPLFTMHLGGADSIVGAVAGVFSVTAVLVRFWAGQAVDSGNRRTIYYTALLVFTLTFMLYHLAGAILPLLAMRVLHGLTWGVLTTAIGTFVADIVPALRRGEGMGYFGGSTSLAMVIGPALGLRLLGSFAFNGLFTASALVAVLGFALTLVIRIPPGHNAGKRVGWHGIVERSALSPSLIMILAGVIYGTVLIFIALYAGQYRLGSGSAFFIVFATVLLLFRPVCGRLFDRFGPAAVLPPGLLLCAAAVILLGIYHAAPALWLAGLLLGLGFGAVQPSLQAMVINRVPPQRRGAATGTLMSAMDLGIGLGAAAMGVIADHWGYNIMFLSSAISGIVAFAWFWLAERRK